MPNKQILGLLFVFTFFVHEEHRKEMRRFKMIETFQFFVFKQLISGLKNNIKLKIDSPADLF